MKKFILIGFIGMLAANNAFADCVATTRTYSSCKPGYYYSGNGRLSTSGGECIKYPTINGVAATSPDKNTGGITSCYAPADKKYTDSVGTYKFENDCNYSN